MLPPRSVDESPRMDAGGAGFLAVVALKSYHLDKFHTPCGVVAGLEENAVSKCPS